MANLQRQLGQYTADFERQAEERSRRFDAEMENRQRRYEEELAAMEERHAAAEASAPDAYLREQKAHERNIESLDETVAAMEAKAAAGETVDQELLAALQVRLKEERSLVSQSYGEYQAALQERQAAEKKALADKHEETVRLAQEAAAREDAVAREAQARRVADIQQRMANEERSYAHARELGERRVADAQAKLAEENAAYDTALAERKAKYDEDVAKVQEGEAKKLEAIRERQEEEARSFQRTMRDAQQAIERANEAYASSGAKASAAVGGSVNQLRQMYDNLASYVGRPLATAQERAGAMLDWIRDKAKSTPFEIPDIQAAVQRLMAYQLDATQFLDTVGNVAAGMSVPVKQVSDAFGALATGQMGEAVMRFREFGVNLKSIEGLKFDARGALVTPVEEALTILKGAMDERFGGMMEAQSKTFKGITSNLRDTWNQFLLVVGKPGFEKLKEGLGGVYAMLEANGPMLEDLGEAIGGKLATLLEGLPEMLEGAMVGMFEWLRSGQAEKDLSAAIETARGFVSFLGDVVKFGADAVGMFRSIRDFVDQNRVALGAVLIVVGLIVAFLGGPLLTAFVLVTAGWILFRDTANQVVQAVIGWWNGFTRDAGRAWDDFNRALTDAWEDLETAWEDLTGTVAGLWEDFSEGAERTWNDFWTTLGRAWATVETTWSNLTGNAQLAWEGFTGGVENAWDGLWAILGGAWDNVRTAWDGLINGSAGLAALWSGFTEGMGTAWKGAAAVFADFLNLIIAGINTIIGAWNRLAFEVPKIEIPDWVPGIGGQTWGGWKVDTPDIATIPAFSLPALAAGGRTIAEGLVQVGERGKEIVWLPSGAEVVGNQATQRALGGREVHYHYSPTIYAPVALNPEFEYALMKSWAGG